MAQVRQRNVALILARELAANLATPMWIWDESGEFVYMNEQAELTIGARMDELGIGRISELSQLQPEDLDGRPIPPAEIASSKALAERRPQHRVIRIVGLDGVKRTLAGTAFPLFARGEELVGVMTVFWNIEDDD